MTTGRPLSLWVVPVALMLLIAIANPPAAFSDGREQSQSASTIPENVQAGKDLYLANCSGCHGSDAAGGVAGEGPNIQRLPATLGDQAVSAIIRDGVHGTGMPAFSQLTGDQRAAIVAFIRTLAPPTPAVVNGDPASGKIVYEENKCAECHIIDGEGGDLGPELTNIGATVQPDVLRQALLNPGGDLPRSRAARDRGKWKEYAVFRAVTKAGRTVQGIRIQETTFSIVLEDAEGKFYTFAKSDLRSLEEESGKSFMPSYRGKLSATQLDDLIAYLSNHGGIR